MSRRYAILDVFANTALKGNPLAVVLDSEGLSDEAMQRLAAEFNLSETIFVMPPTKPAHTASVRIFTPQCELPFAGHPTIGCAALLAMEQWGEEADNAKAVIMLEEKIGSVRAGVTLTGRIGYAEFDVPTLPEEKASPGEREDLAAALGLSRHEIGFENHQPSVFVAGVPFCYVPVADLAAIRKAACNRQVWADVFTQETAPSVFVYTRDVVTRSAHFHARLFAPAMGIDEDPATGSAVAAFAGVINAFDKPLSGTHRYEIEQGFEMGRPSRIVLEMDVARDQIEAARIGGEAVLIARGELYLDDSLG